MSLARAQVDRATDFLEFLAGGRFSPEERHGIREGALGEFLHDPANALSGYASIEDTVGRIRAFNGDKVKEAELREAAIAAIHLHYASQPPQAFEEAAAAALFSRVPVLGADEEEGIVVTKLGLDGLLDSNDFVAELIGHDKMRVGERERIGAEIAAGLSKLSADDRSVLARGLSRWTRVQVFWAGLSAQECTTVTGELRRMAPRAADVPVAARQLETSARLALFSQHVNQSMLRTNRAQMDETVLDVMRDRSGSFGD